VCVCVRARVVVFMCVSVCVCVCVCVSAQNGSGLKCRILTLFALVWLWCVRICMRVCMQTKWFAQGASDADFGVFSMSVYGSSSENKKQLISLSSMYSLSIHPFRKHTYIHTHTCTATPTPTNTQT
jgi:hypothetical protein